MNEPTQPLPPDRERYAPGSPYPPPYPQPPSESWTHAWPGEADPQSAGDAESTDPAGDRATTGSGLARASLALGIAGLVSAWWTYGILSLAAVASGHLALRRARPGGDGQRARGLAMGGLILGYAVVLVTLAVSIAVLIGDLPARFDGFAGR